MTYEIEITAQDKPRRQALCSAIGNNLLLAGAKIAPGTYRVTIERVRACRVCDGDGYLVTENPSGRKPVPCRYCKDGKERAP